MCFRPEIISYRVFKILKIYSVPVLKLSMDLFRNKTPVESPNFPRKCMINLLRIDEHVNIVETIFIWLCFDTNFFNEITFEENSFNIGRINFFAIFQYNYIF